MKKTAVLIYNQFCNFEISVALEILSMAQKPFTLFAKELSAVTSEERLRVLPDQKISDICFDEYDSLLLPGAMDIREAIEDAEILSFIRRFDNEEKIIGAISIAPILLLKSGVMKNRPFMAGVNREELLGEGYTPGQLSHMQGWDDNKRNPIKDGYLISGNIITSVSYEFVRFGLAFCRMLGIEIAPETFGVKS